MGFSKYFQSNSMRSSVTNYKDYARLPMATPPSRPPFGVLRTWADGDGFLNFHDGSYNIVGRFLTGIQATYDKLIAAVKPGAGDHSVIVGSGGSFPNSATGQYNVVGGCANVAAGSNNLVAGSGCRASSRNNLLTGQNNTINAATYCDGNSVAGCDNVITGEFNAVSGLNNVVQGHRNNVSGEHNQVLSSLCNEVSGQDQVVSGTYNLVSGKGHNIQGGFNQVSGQEHAIPVARNHSLIHGHQAACYNNCQSVHAAGKFALGSAGNAQFTTILAKGITTSLTPVDLMVDTWSPVSLASNKGYAFTVRIFGTIEELNRGYVKEVKGAIYKGANNFATALLAPVIESVILDMGDGFTAVVAACTTYGALKITVTGHETMPVRWIARVEMLEISFL
jgi:hypothetical protein